MDHAQLRALATIIDTGSFEAAAAVLHLTPSAVSQRIKALESGAGQVLVRRARPCRATEAGTVLARLARQLDEVESDARLALGTLSSAPLHVVVNADSLATWFTQVLAKAAEWTDTELRLRVADEAISHRLLRGGEVIGAVTTWESPIAGCRATPLGDMHYVPVAAPGLAASLAAGQWFGADTAAICYDPDDEIIDRFVATEGLPSPERRHLIPSSQGYVSALLVGLGWGLAPRPQIADRLVEGSLVRVHRHDLTEALSWQCWSLHSRRLDRLTAAVESAAVGLDSTRTPPDLPNHTPA